MTRFKSVNTLLFIAYSTLLSILAPVYLPNVMMATFAPFLTILYTECSYATSLWASLFVGLFFDLMASKIPLGFYSLSYCLTTTCVYRYRRFFLLDKWWIFPLYTAIFSAVSSLIQILLLAIFNAKVPIHMMMILSDLCIMPMIDACFALLFFILPYTLFKYLANPSRIHYLKERVKSWKRLISQS